MSIVFPTTPQEPITRDPRLLVLFAQPKMGKTTALGLLPNNLLIDLEDGSDHVKGLILKATSFAELVQIKDELIAQGISYDYITLDTTTALEEMSKDLAALLYKATPMGKDFGKKGSSDVTKLPNGAGL